MNTYAAATTAITITEMINMYSVAVWPFVWCPCRSRLIVVVSFLQSVYHGDRSGSSHAIPSGWERDPGARGNIVARLGGTAALSRPSGILVPTLRTPTSQGA